MKILNPCRRSTSQRQCTCWTSWASCGTMLHIHKRHVAFLCRASSTPAFPKASRVERWERCL
ncbi:hypothetical protein BV20DRAFT_145717 [Pilatotrama ljubarskyi]|nr:hypothetical protein BV20DRAFT_145717 [Pilatotrama ljubarskyi]